MDEQKKPELSKNTWFTDFLQFGFAKPVFLAPAIEQSKLMPRKVVERQPFIAFFPIDNKHTVRYYCKIDEGKESTSLIRENDPDMKHKIRLQGDHRFNVVQVWEWGEAEAVHAYFKKMKAKEKKGLDINAVNYLLPVVKQSTNKRKKK
jgi:hypothetical protein